jgi:transposase
MEKISSLNLSGFYPESLAIRKVTEMENQITIKLKSQKHSHICRQCNEEMRSYHGTYIRTAQDLPILGKQVVLKITSYEYYCTNGDCPVISFVEDYEGFLGKSERMTRRCEELIKAIAYETSCEGASVICKKIGIKISGDTIIRMVKKAVDQRPAVQCSEIIGVDDFAYKKGHTYCTIICDGESHAPIEILDGRDGETLKEWLKNNKHVKKVTRDRSGVYAKAISDILPDAMQVADRFHLHQNLFTAVKEAFKSVLPNEIPIPNAIFYGETMASSEEPVMTTDEMTSSEDKKN